MFRLLSNPLVLSLFFSESQKKFYVLIDSRIPIAICS